MDQLNPKVQFDTIVIGTSLSSSILASSLSLNGSDVLHLDVHSYYGEWDATMSVKKMVQMAGVRNGMQRERDRQILYDRQDENGFGMTLRPGCTVIPVYRNPDDIFEGNDDDHHDQEPSGHEIGTSSHAHIQDHSSSWACLEQLDISISPTDALYTALLGCEIDLCPKHLLCCERLISLLASSSGGHYVNFTPITAMYICTQEQNQEYQDQLTMVRVPCSRADVFQSDYLSLAEKRVLMKMLKQTAEDQELSEDLYTLYPPSRDTEFHSGMFQQNASAGPSLPVEPDSSYASFLFKEHVDKKIQDIIYHGIAFLDDDLFTIGKQEQMQMQMQIQTQDVSAQVTKSLALKRISTFLRSLTRFPGTLTPFLITNHGSAELCQAFCRIAAVRGATYMLRTGIKALVLNEEKKCVGVVSTDNQVIYARRRVFVSSNMYRLTQPNETSPQPRSFLYRFIGIRNMAVSFNKEWEKEQFFATFPPKSRAHNSHLVRVYQHKTITRSRETLADALLFTIYAESADMESVLKVLEYMSQNVSVADRSTTETTPDTQPASVSHDPFLLRVIIKFRALAGPAEQDGPKYDCLDFVDSHYTSMAINSDLQVLEAAIQFHKVFPTTSKYWNP